ncbi:beta-glucuronidase [Lactobacillus crispatus]|jgi:beta-glucuronidase|uniref:beta-glucuronidase n=1 Tax=Lactobacillus crispatus TaxID=47770 RepID=UPI0018AA99A7|nr:beta-glucuronidase [Lactobacillus crispatus]MCH4004847.1 beta-glucuronidase [Lactobacillus crispatus]MCI1336555.1 beta-glucuronidase [Lactobacillus crispatus]MCI1366085.1 beta-glucuronidase [Lactobacillus crispatus]MCI1494405.1 beta-glucuronidase [Lactobacillus crispatus]
MESALYPIQNKYRFNTLMNGSWQFETDPDSIGLKEGWNKELPDPEAMPVPGTFAELTTKRERKYYTGDFWYQKDFFVPSFLQGRDIFIRFGSVTHRAKVFINGHEVGQHEGGFLPFQVKISDYIKLDQKNRLTILVNNELSEKTIPCGTETVLSNGQKLAQPYFDFFNYSGIMRNVWLLALPQIQITNFKLDYQLSNNTATINYQIESNDNNTEFKITLLDHEEALISTTSKDTGRLTVKNPHLWQPNDPYLYKIKIEMLQNDKVVDEYTDQIGIRTIKVVNDKILLNNQPIYLKGFGKHEDFNVLGKATNESIIKRDYECMKWIGANCFRSSHYPYAEEWYQYADKYGFLIIDEVPAVGLNRSVTNFLNVTNSNQSHFFAAKTVPQLKQVHQQEIKEMIDRDQRHPSVIAWSLFNEPESTTPESYDYFKDIFTYAKKLDPQKRPYTGTLVMGSGPKADRLHSLCDIVCLNRYYGWYVAGGPEIVNAKGMLMDELNGWQDLKLNKPFVFTEFGADTLASLHQLPDEMWSQEYQNEYYQMYFDIFKKYPFIQGELVWNFADFKTSEGIMRVGGNAKGVFTREREPKDIAFVLRKRWR